MTIAVDSVFKLLLYGMGFMSVFGIAFSLQSNYTKMRERIRLQRERKLLIWNSKWIQHSWLKKYHMLLESSIKQYELQHFSKIVVLQLSLFIGLWIFLWVAIQSFSYSLGISFLLTIGLPLAGVYFIYKRKEKEIQENLIETSIRLLQEYEKSGKQMVFALKNTAEDLTGTSQIVFSKMFARMHDDDATKTLAAETLAFQIGHFRGKNLATIILRACKDGIDVSPLLHHLVEDITGFNKRARNAETEATDAAMIGYAILPALIILYFVNDRWLIPDGRTFEYQFETAQGLKSFLIAFIFGVIGLGLAVIVKKPRK